MKIFKIANNNDEEYLSAVERGDMGKAQRMVDDDAKAKGYIGPVLHGTSSSFTSFDRDKISKNYNPKLGDGFYFTESKKMAEYYAKNGDTPSILKFYILFNNPLNIFSIKEYRNAAMPNLVDKQAPILSYNDVLKSKGYDGIILRNNGIMEEIVAFNPSQIKSADPVTRDSNGNIIPLSKRFDATNNLINY